MAERTRTFWKGYLRLALVTIPVRMMTATRADTTFHFHQIDRKSKQRIRYQKVVPGKGVIPAEDIVSGYEVEPGNYVLFEGDELDAVKLETRHTIELTQFVDNCEINPLYFEKPYYLLPDGDIAEEGYRVIRDALRDARKVGIGQLTLRGKENLVALQASGEGLLLDTPALRERDQGSRRRLQGYQPRQAACEHDRDGEIADRPAFRAVRPHTVQEPLHGGAARARAIQAEERQGHGDRRRVRCPEKRSGRRLHGGAEAFSRERHGSRRRRPRRRRTFLCDPAQARREIRACKRSNQNAFSGEKTFGGQSVSCRQRDPGGQERQGAGAGPHAQGRMMAGAARKPPGSSARAKLAAYRAKRDFAATREPRDGGKRAAKNAPAFVVQHHWATRDHYDFRLEMGGVMKSWAVTRGPSTDPADKRLAVRTEDHPIAYNAFEGTIPKGQYGGGTVMLWDRGTFEPLADHPQTALDEGKLAFNLHGTRMHGRWALVRMKGRRPGDGGRENWLLIKEKDEFARPLGDFLDAATTSVASGRTRAQLESGDAAVWQSNRADPLKSAPAPARAASSQTAARRGSPPAFTKPMLATLTDTAPEGEDWRYEIKYDGYRLQACVNGATVQLFTREGLNWTTRFPTIARALASLDLPRCAIDGEAVVFDERGISDFAKLVASLESDKAHIDFVAFDLLAQGRADLRGRPLSHRRATLETLLARADGDTIRIAPTMTGEGARMFEAAVAGGAEGIVAKRVASTYQSRRSTEWLKVKGEHRMDVVVVGYMPSKKRLFSSLAVAVEEKGGLRFAGGVGSGFSQEELARTWPTLQALTQKAPAPMTNREIAAKKIVWLKPKLTAEIQFAGFTGDNQLRHARFLGWKADRRGAAPARKQAPSASAPDKPPRTSAKASSPVRLTHPERILIPGANITKQMLADYLLAVADRILPHLAERPVSFVRAPDGIDGERFFQRHSLPGMKTGIGKVPDPGRGHGDYLQVLSADGLVTAAQFSVVELHGWGAKLPDLRKPDRVVFDLDPDESLAFADVRCAAIDIGNLLEQVGLASWPLLSGGKGIHVIAPLDATQDWDIVGGFAEHVAKGLAQAAPDRFVGVMSKEKRKGRIFIDYLRNRPSASAIVPWSPRARHRGTAAVPVTWDELRKVRAADQFTLATAAKRSDPWSAEFFATRQSVAEAALDALRKSVR